MNATKQKPKIPKNNESQFNQKNKYQDGDNKKQAIIKQGSKYSS